jgi:4-amino-4-deoxychorismate lyase
MHLINGQAGDSVAITDRGLLYGQSVFETIAVSNGKPHLLKQHMQRLQLGCETLAIPFDLSVLQSEIDQVCQLIRQERAVLRVTVTMGSGGRGYANPEQASATRLISVHDYPDLPLQHWQTGILLGTAEIRLAAQPALAGIKHGNRLEQVIARSQWQADWHEALLLDHQERVIEGTQSNLFVVKDEVIYTPDLSQCGVAGVMRNHILALADSNGVASQIVSLSEADLIAADEVFMSNSLVGIWPVQRFRERAFNDFSLSHKLLKILEKNGAIPTH